MISHLINFLQLPPNQNSLNLINKIQHLKIKQYQVNYLFYNNHYLLISTYNHFQTLSNPHTIHLKYFPTLQSLIQSI